MDGVQRSILLTIAKARLRTGRQFTTKSSPRLLCALLAKKQVPPACLRALGVGMTRVKKTGSITARLSRATAVPRTPLACFAKRLEFLSVPVVTSGARGSLDCARRFAHDDRRSDVDKRSTAAW